MEELSIIKKYPKENYNLLGNTELIANIPDIKSPVIQAVRLDTDLKEGDVYIQQNELKEWFDNNGKRHPATPKLYAITKNGLKKLADGAGIKMISSEHVIPATCQKCVAVNQNTGKVVQCGNCKNKDVAYRVTISVPQLTGEILTVEDTHEIIVDNVTPSMTAKQIKEFMKHLPQICEAKALNGAIRTALHIKGTYKFEELQKPFVVAYLVPNLNQEDVKRAAIENMFGSSNKLFGVVPSVQQIETRAPEGTEMGTDAGENLDSYIDGRYEDVETEVASKEPPIEATQDLRREMTEEDRAQDFCCDKCGKVIPEKVWEYSMEHDGMPLCFPCQKIVHRENGGR